MVVSPYVPKEGGTPLCNKLHKIGKNYTPRMCRQEHLSEVLDLYVFVTSHVSLTPYSFDFHKCSDVSCCVVKRSLSQFKGTAM